MEKTLDGDLRWNEQTGSCRRLRDRDGSRNSRCGFSILPKPNLGTADCEYRHRPDFRSFLLEIPQALMNEAQ
jgi:hypothetical protein